MGAWGFQYRPERGRDFAIEEGVDIAMTHGPPKGIMDFTHGRERAGCPDLFAAVARARPQVHCFGHIHEGWGARLVAWRDNCGKQPNHFSAIDNSRSRFVEKLTSLRPCELDTHEEAEQRARKGERYDRDKCCTTSHCAGDEHPLEKGKQTLFVNASICDGGLLVQKPWVVDIELPIACQQRS